MRKYLISLLILVLAGSIAEPARDFSCLDSVIALRSYGGAPNRDLDAWKRDIAEYSRRHYGPAEWKITPTAIVLHYTASADFPMNLLVSESFQGEAPGLASHFVVQQKGKKILMYQLLPLDVMSRATFGANFCSISIEIVAVNEEDLLSRPVVLDAVSRLVSELMVKYSIPAERVFGHEEIDEMLAADPRGMFFDNTIQGKFVPRKIDPGKRVMEYVRGRIASVKPI
jgi:N-acetyl-anhydromuramyl-L-alanine amidase AmpD